MQVNIRSCEIGRHVRRITYHLWQWSIPPLVLRWFPQLYFLTETIPRIYILFVDKHQPFLPVLTRSRLESTWNACGVKQKGHERIFEYLTAILFQLGDNQLQRRRYDITTFKFFDFQWSWKITWEHMSDTSIFKQDLYRPLCRVSLFKLSHVLYNIQVWQLPSPLRSNGKRYPPAEEEKSILSRK